MDVLIQSIPNIYHSYISYIRQSTCQKTAPYICTAPPQIGSAVRLGPHFFQHINNASSYGASNEAIFAYGFRNTIVYPIEDVDNNASNGLQSWCNYMFGMSYCDVNNVPLSSGYRTGQSPYEYLHNNPPKTKRTFNPIGKTAGPSAPTFSPSSKTSLPNQDLTITISSSVSGATIYYTKDGSDPTTTLSPSKPASEGVSLTLNKPEGVVVTIKAMVSKDGKSSSIATASYSFGTPILTSIIVSPSSASVLINGTQSLTAIAKDQFNNPMTGITFTWTSSNSSVATVNSSGLVTGKILGSATITAVSGSLSATAAITVSATDPNPPTTTTPPPPVVCGDSVDEKCPDGCTYLEDIDCPLPPPPPDITPPTIPQKLTATGSITVPAIDLMWRASTDDRGVAGYNIYKDGKKIATANRLSYTDTDVVFGETHIYAVTAFDEAPNESEKSDPATAMSAPLNAEFMKSVSASDFPQIIGNFLKWILTVAGSLAMLIIIIGGVMYISSSGDEQKTILSKKIVLGAIGGLILILTAYSIVTLLGRIV